MKKVVTIVGSNSQKSINKLLIAYAANLLKKVEIVTIDLNDYILPTYGVDLEAENGKPTAVKRLDKITDSADAYIIPLEELNGSYTAVFKNTLDWLSRLDMKVWKEKPMLLMATSLEAREGATILESATTSFSFLGAKIMETYSLPSFYDNFKEGEVIDEHFRKELKNKIAVFSKQL